MKLLKKIAPLAISALMLAAPLAGAVNINNWKSTFNSGSTAVVVGSGTIGELDMAAALTVARAVGIDTVTNTVGGEAYYIEKSSNKFNLGNNFTDIITGSIDEDELATILAKGTYLDIGSNEFEYNQDITFATNRQLKHFTDSSYEDGEPSLGIYIPSSGYVLNYTLDFTTEPDWDDADLEKTTIDLMGKPYYISDVNEAASSITLLDVSETKTIAEQASDVLGGKTVMVNYISSTSTVKLTIDGKTSNALAIGAVYSLGGDKYLAVKDVMYVAKDTGTSQVELAIGNGKIDLVNHELVEINDDDIEGLTAHVDNSSTKFQAITLQWAVDEEAFIAGDTTLTLPGFETVTLGMSGFEFPEEEVTTVSAGDDYLEIVVPIESGEATIPLLYLNSSDTGFDNFGKESGQALKTATISNLVFNTSATDEAFIATWVSGEEAETYYLKATTYASNNVNYTKVYDLVAEEYVCEDIDEGDTCDVSSNLVLTALDVNVATANKWTNFTAGTGVNFYKIYTKEGLLIYAPHGTSGTNGYFNASADPTTYVLEFDEEDKEGAFASGEEFNVTVGISTANLRVTVTALTSNWSGGNYFELDSDPETYVGYVWSDLATKLSWDRSADEDPVEITYHGAESYGKVYITEGTTTSSSSSWTAVKDSETSAYTGKNVIAIGGTAVNKVARKMLGLDEATPVFGSDSAWSTATGVNAVGKGILWIKTSPYTTGKYAMLVAGYEGADTEKTANFLTLVTPLPAKDKAVIDTVNNVEATA